MIRRLYVHNFRCLDNFSLNLNGLSSALLIGKNGTGKSSIGSVLKILQQIARGTNRVKELVTSKDFFANREGVPLRIELEVEIEHSIFNYKIGLELPHDFKELRVLEESLSCDQKLIYSRQGAQVSYAKTVSEVEAKFLIDWHYIALPIIQEQSKTDPLAKFKIWLSQILILSPSPRHIRGDSSGDTLFPNYDVTNFGEWFTGLLSHSPAAYSVIESYLKQVMPDFLAITNPTTGTESRSLFVEFKAGNTKLALPFSDLSDGEKTFIICAVSLAAMEFYGPLFLYWDEPDTFLSLPETSEFIVNLRRASSKAGQFLATSHNPQVISRFSNENTFYLSRKSHLEPASCQLINDLDISGDLIEALLLDEIEV